MSESRKSALFIATTTDPNLGGIARSVPKLAEVCKGVLSEGVELQFLVPKSPAEANRAIEESAGNISFVYHAGVWDPINHAVAKASRRNGIPLVVSTRSMLDPWALNHRKWKKKLAWWLYAKRDLMSATLIHATAEMEAEFIRNALGEGCPPIIVVPNGVELGTRDERPGTSDQGRATAVGVNENDSRPSSLVPRPIKRILFLSRIHPKKGVLDLIKAFGDLNPDGWELVIAGNDDGGHQAVCEDFASHQVNADRIRFMGAVSDADKWEVYRSADLFVLPSYSENFGIVIGEALGMGVPVITTTATPWGRMKEKGCGWWIDTGVDALIPTLREAIGLHDGSRRAMGQRGSDWIRSEFTWESVGEQFVNAVRQYGLL